MVSEYFELNKKNFMKKLEKNINGHANLQDCKLHPLLKDIENIFNFFMLANIALADPEVQNKVRAKKESTFLLNEYNKWVNLKIKISEDGTKFNTSMNLLDGMIFIGKAMVVMMYDTLSASKYNSSINTSENIKFLRFIRNGVAHHNKFNLKDEKGEWKLGEHVSIKWRDKKIIRELHGKKVLNDFIGIFDIVFLAMDFSVELMKIDKQKTKDVIEKLGK